MKQYIIVQTQFDSESLVPLYQIARSVGGSDVYAVSLARGNDPTPIENAEAFLNEILNEKR